VLSFNEARACDAIIRQIEARANARRVNVCLHDNHPDPRRRVELTFEVSPQLYAMEHTGIEPFSDFMRMNQDSLRLFDPIKRGVSPAVSPNETIEVQIPVGALTNRSNKDLELIQDALVRHVIALAPGVPVRSYAEYIGDIRPATPPGVPFPVTVYRFHAPWAPARCQIVHSVGGDRESLRAERLRLACEKKFPKLAVWKNSNGARTVLVMEDNDIQLTSPPAVADAFLPIAKSRDDRPDETYMLMTCTDPWYAWPILIDDMTYFDLAQSSYPSHFEINPATLMPVTGASHTVR
jgi:hypothetical protein